jgi:hypothetical protein
LSCKAGCQAARDRCRRVKDLIEDDGGVVQLESGKDLPNTCNADIQLSLPNIKLKKQI